MLTLKEIFPVTMSQQDSTLQQQLRRAQTFSKIYAYSIVSFFCVMVAYTIKNYYQNGADKFPWQLWIPFSYDDSRIYVMIVVWIWWLQFTISTLSFGADFLLFTTVLLTSVNFNALKKEAESSAAQPQPTSRISQSNLNVSWSWVMSLKVFSLRQFFTASFRAQFWSASSHFRFHSKSSSSSSF